MKFYVIIISFLFIQSGPAFGQEAHAWNLIFRNSTTFKIKHDKSKLPPEIIKMLFDSIYSLANPNEKVNKYPGELPNGQLKWFAVDQDNNYVIFTTYYNVWRNYNLCFLVSGTSKERPLVVTNIEGDLDFKEFKIVFLNQDIKVDIWTEE